jgi:hypothetical protein
LYNDNLVASNLILYSNGTFHLDVVTLRAQGTFSMNCFRSVRILSRILKSAHETFISKSAQVGGPDLASCTLIFTQGILILLAFSLNLAAISQLFSFLQYSFLTKLTVIPAKLSDETHPHQIALFQKAVCHQIVVV